MGLSTAVLLQRNELVSSCRGLNHQRKESAEAGDRSVVLDEARRLRGAGQRRPREQWVGGAEREMYSHYVW